jgi:hypothetical protein
LEASKEEAKKVDVGLSRVSVLENRLERVKKELQEEEDKLNVQESQREILDTQGDRKE